MSIVLGHAQAGARRSSWWTALVAGAVTLVTGATTAAANPPTIGIEWELEAYPAVVGVQTDEVVGPRIVDAKTIVNGQPLLCTAAVVNQLPLVNITMDMEAYNERTLEIVTGPIEYDDKTRWDETFRFLDGFFAALYATCTKSTFTTSSWGTQTYCFASVDAVQKQLAQTQKIEVGQKCGGTSFDLTKVGFIVKYEVNGEKPPLDKLFAGTVGTQVNIGLRVRSFAETDLSTLFPEATWDLDEVTKWQPFEKADANPRKDRFGIARAAYQNAVKEVAGWKDVSPEVKGYMVLFTYALNAHAGFWRTPFWNEDKKNLDKSGPNTPVIGAADVGGNEPDYKNMFGLYPKASLGGVYKSLNIASLKLPYGDRMCVASNPKGKACGAYAKTWLETMQKVPSTPRDDDPIDRKIAKPIPFTVTPKQEHVVVVETRSEVPLSNNATLVVTGNKVGFKAYDAVKKELDPLKY